MTSTDGDGPRGEGGTDAPTSRVMCRNLYADRTAAKRFVEFAVPAASTVRVTLVNSYPGMAGLRIEFDEQGPHG